MKRRTFLAASGALLATRTAGAQGWAEYRSDEGNFHVEMPSIPKLDKADIPIGNKESAPMVEAVARTRGATYQASFIVYPRRISGAASGDVMLDTFRNNMSSGHSYRNETKISLGRFPGREFTVVESPTRSIAVRLYWIQGRLYQLLVTGAAGIEAKPDTRRFFNSFGLINT